VALKTEIEKAKNLVQQFHDKENLFGIAETPYPDLFELEKNFDPFCKLITTAEEALTSLSDWK
jgi:hypothetical protein